MGENESLEIEEESKTIFVLEDGYKTGAMGIRTVDYADDAEGKFLLEFLEHLLDIIEMENVDHLLLIKSSVQWRKLQRK